MEHTQQAVQQAVTWCDPRVIAALIAAAATFSASMVALFFKELRARLRPPVLNVGLARATGISATVYLTMPGANVAGTREEKSRYYHIRVSNPRRKADAVHGVTLNLLRWEQRAADGTYHTKWDGSVPMIWRNQADPARPEHKVIGTDADADLCSVIRGKFLQLHLVIVPSDLVVIYRVEMIASVDIILTVQAKGNEVDSAPQRYRIFWDGKWEDGEQEMRKHFHVTPVEAHTVE